MGLKALQDPQIIKRFLVNSFPNLAKMLHVGIFPKELSDFYFSVVRNTIKYREENSVKRNDFMNLMIQMKNSTGSDNITVDQITAQSFIFFLAGYETAATTLTYCLYELSLNKDYQERLRNEIKEVLEKHDNNVTYEAITEMTYMDQVLDETLRKYPPAPLVQRICKADYKVPGTNFTWKANTNIKIPIYAIHHDPEIYPNPDVFDPERFTPEEVAKRHPCSFIPFGSGPRLCIGMRFALIEAKIALVKLLTTFKFESFKKLEISKTQILLQPEGGVLIKFEKL
jgi:cytochrome P450 family 6